MESAEIGLVHRYIDAYNALDVAGMCGCLHPDVRFENWSSGRRSLVLNGLAAFEAQAQMAARMFSERMQTVTELVWEGDEIHAQIAYRGTLKMTIPGGAKKGETVELKGKSVFGFRDGKIVLLRDES